MLKKNLRLKNNKAFGATYRLGRIVKNSFFMLFCGKVKPDENIPQKVGFVVSKKIHKRAVVRNKIKRKMREAYFDYLKTNPDTPFVSLVFKAEEACIETDFFEIKNAMFDLLEKTEKFKNI